MSTELKEAPKKRAKARRNYFNEVRLLEMYVKAAVRISEGNPAPTEHDKGKLEAYKDIQAFIEGK